MTYRCYKVITTSFIGGVVRDKTELIGNPPGYFNHSQNFPDEASVLNLVKLNLEIERNTDPGLAVDTIIVNNDTGWERGNGFLKALDQTPTYGGKLVVLQRERKTTGGTLVRTKTSNTETNSGAQNFAAMRAVRTAWQR